jgi:hypothetical protein
MDKLPRLRGERTGIMHANPGGDKGADPGSCLNG